MDVFFIAVDETTQKRQRQKARDLRNSQWWKRRRSQGICHYCKRVFPPRELTMDHLVPVARGGMSIKSNVVPCCKDCNTKKRQLLPLEWDEYMKTLSKI
ncbi:MAG: HNH endonuclease [Desulfobacterium sp.]|jgi:5-methylcytosine-specific restriction endonuclease McrA|nr:HNH endonuclease [Desulfobacterium sp.]